MCDGSRQGAPIHIDRGSSILTFPGMPESTRLMNSTHKLIHPNPSAGSRIGGSLRSSMRSHAGSLLLACVLTLASAHLGCAGEGDDGRNVLVTRPVLNVEAAGRLIQAGAAITVSPYTSVATVVTVTNAGDADLQVTDVRLISSSSNIRLAVDTQQLPAIVPPALGVTPSQWSFELSVVAEPGMDVSADTAELVLTTNHQRDGATEFRATVVVQASPPQIVVPSLLDLGTVVPGSIVNRDVTITNAGVEPLAITKLTLQAPTAFDWAAAADQSADVAAATRVGRDLHYDPAWTVEPGTSVVVILAYNASDPAPSTGDIRVFSNDPITPQAHVAIQANVGGPCLAVSATELAFGGKYVGATATAELSLTSCGSDDLIVHNLSFADGSSDAFNAALDDISFPLVLPVNKTFTIPITFIPDAVAEVVDGAPEMHKGSFVITANTALAERTVALSGWGVDTLCPTAVIGAVPEEVIPQTVLHLDATQSFAATGGVDAYLWEVVTPSGDVEQFLPSSTAPQPTFQVNLVGQYTFVLKVRDANGQWTSDSGGCLPATRTVLVVSDELIHVELLWHTPGDPDETDIGSEAGADLDLHFVHPFALASGGDGWFHPVFDTYWSNIEPNWNDYTETFDDPSLDRDDTDGGGPENVNLDNPEVGVTYRVGVHYWDDHGFGDSDATVRIYIHSTLVYERAGVTLWPDDMWHVADIAWPSAQVTAVTLPDGQLDIVPHYPRP